MARRFAHKHAKAARHRAKCKAARHRAWQRLEKKKIEANNTLFRLFQDAILDQLDVGLKTAIVKAHMAARVFEVEYLDLLRNLRKLNSGPGDCSLEDNVELHSRFADLVVEKFPDFSKDKIVELLGGLLL